MNIPNEAIEAAARSYQEILVGNGQPPWDDLPKQRQDNRLYWMRAALEAAAPYLARQTLTNAANTYPLETAYGGAEHAITWLRERAAHIEAPDTSGASLMQGEK